MNGPKSTNQHLENGLYFVQNSENEAGYYFNFAKNKNYPDLS